MEWTLLRAPLDLPDGEYSVTTTEGYRFHATRKAGFWIHQDSADPAHAAPETHARDTAPSGPGFFNNVRHVAGVILQFDERYGISLLLLAVLITYGLPTVVELVAAIDAHLGLVVLLFGDLIGCACLATFLEMPVFGVSLYLALTVCEALLYFTGFISPGHLAWFADLVPMLVVTRRIARIRAVAYPMSSGQRLQS